MMSKRSVQNKIELCEEIIKKLIIPNKLFLVYSSEIDKNYIDGLELLPIPSDMVGESIISSFIFDWGGMYKYYRITIDFDDINKLCCSIKCASVKTSDGYLIDGLKNSEFKTVAKLYLPTMDIILYDDNVSFPEPFAEALYCNLTIEDPDTGKPNYIFMINYIVNELESINRTYCNYALNPDFFESIRNYLIYNFEIKDNTNGGLVHYWKNYLHFVTEYSPEGKEAENKNDIDEEYFPDEKPVTKDNGLIYDMEDEYFFIKSRDLRNYLHSKNIKFHAWDKAYLIYNSGLGEYTIAEKLKELLNDDSGCLTRITNRLREQITKRVEYMEYIRSEFRKSKPNQVFMGMSFNEEDNKYYPELKLYHEFDPCYKSMADKFAGHKFRIHKLNISDSKNDRLPFVGYAQFNEIGECIYNQLNDISMIIEKDEHRFEVYSNVTLPHPFTRGNLVTDGTDILYVINPCCADEMHVYLDELKLKKNFSYSTCRFIVDVYAVDDKGNLYLTTADIRDISLISSVMEDKELIKSMILTAKRK